MCLCVCKSEDTGDQTSRHYAWQQAPPQPSPSLRIYLKLFLDSVSFYIAIVAPVLGVFLVAFPLVLVNIFFDT